MSKVLDVAKAAQSAARSGRVSAALSHTERNRALSNMAESLLARRSAIEEANAADVAAAKDAGLARAMVGRLGFADAKFDAAVAGVRDLQRLPDPIGEVQVHRQLADGLVLKRVAVPLGVLGIIFEARPDAAVQIASLAVKSGNGVLLKCGREAVRTCTEIVGAMREGLEATQVPEESVVLLSSREQTAEMLTCSDHIDLIIPRGSNEFVQHVQRSTTIPVLGHADGICHVYVDASADLTKALKIAIDSKTQYPSACNSMETLLVHEAVAPAFLPAFFAAAAEKNVRVNGCERTKAAAAAAAAAPVGDVATWAHEYCDLECSVRVVASGEEAVGHIVTYGSKHTDCVVAEDAAAAAAFQSQVPSAGVFHNCSTRFADGFRYGLGAEVGVSTSTMPPRGPVGLDGIVTYKYLLRSDDEHVVSDFASGAKSFSHKDI